MRDKKYSYEMITCMKYHKCYLCGLDIPHKSVVVRRQENATVVGYGGRARPPFPGPPDRAHLTCFDQAVNNPLVSGLEPTLSVTNA